MLKLKKINILYLFILLGCFQTKNSCEKTIKLAEKPLKKANFVQKTTPEIVKNIFKAIEELNEKDFSEAFSVYIKEHALEALYLNEFGETMLAAACRKGFFEILNCMLQFSKFREAINQKNIHGYTPLILAVWLQPYKQGIYEVTLEKKFELIKLLLKKGADVHIRDNEGVSAILYAARFMQQLLSCSLLKISILVDGPDKEKAKQEAKLEQGKAKEIIDLLKSRGAGLADLFNERNKDLFEFCKEKKILGIKFEHKMDEEARQKIIDKALIEAVRSRDASKVFLIIEEGANPNVKEEGSKSTALHIACSNLSKDLNADVIRIIQLLYKPRTIFLKPEGQLIWGKLDATNRLGETPIGLYLAHLINTPAEYKKILRLSCEEDEKPSIYEAYHINSASILRDFLNIINYEKDTCLRKVIKHVEKPGAIDIKKITQAAADPRIEDPNFQQILIAFCNQRILEKISENKLKKLLSVIGIADNIKYISAIDCKSIKTPKQLKTIDILVAIALI